MICLAYDASLNGDWVARYAIRFAVHSEEKLLNLVHVRDGSLPDDQLERKLEHLERECLAQGVELVPEIVDLDGSVIHALHRALTVGPADSLICGTRVRVQGRPYLAGTIAEKLLQHPRCNVLAIRVVQPGLLGCPRHLLLPLGGHPRGFGVTAPFLRLFLPDIDTVHLMRALPVSTYRLRHLDPLQMQALRQRGVRHLAEVSNAITRMRNHHEFRLDSRILVCDDLAREILVHASHLKAGLVLLGASERTWWHRLLQASPIERVLRGSPCDVGICRAP